jgi:hypothetical protein
MPLDLDELEAAVGKMTPGPWVNTPDGIIQVAHVTRDVWNIPHVDADLPGIVALRNAAPELIAAARERELERGINFGLKTDLERVVAQRNELAALLRECMAVLAQVEYADNSGHEYRAKCPACHQASTERHLTDCTLHGTFKRIDAALAKVGP